MLRLEKSEALGRVIRKDDLSELGVSTWTKIKEAIQAGRNQEALDLVDYLKSEGKRIHDSLCDAFWGWQTYVANKYGEDEMYQAMRQLAEPFYKELSKLSPLEFVRLRCESMRAHRSGRDETGDVTVTEEDERYVITFDPCGSGGRMRRTGRMEPPFNYGKTKKAYPWSWGKAGVPYYCTHCAIWSEILPIEWYGYPQRITAYSEDRDAPCAWYIYKDPERIPEEYFLRVGKKK